MEQLGFDNDPARSDETRRVNSAPALRLTRQQAAAMSRQMRLKADVNRAADKFRQPGIGIADELDEFSVGLEEYSELDWIEAVSKRATTPRASGEMEFSPARHWRR